MAEKYRTRPATKAELQRWLRVAEEDLASAQAASEVSRMHAVELRRDIAKAEAERDHMQAMLTDAQAELGEARGRIAQLEEALASAGRDVSAIREGEDAERAAWQSALDAEREERQAEQQRHAVEMGEMRSALLHLCVQLEREIRRGGGV